MFIYNLIFIQLNIYIQLNVYTIQIMMPVTNFKHQIYKFF